VSGWLFNKKSIMLHGNMNIKFNFFVCVLPKTQAEKEVALIILMKKGHMCICC